MAFALAALLAGCSGGSRDDPSSERRNHRSTACNPFAVGSNGHLPACAAGTSSAAGPGVPFDFAGRVQAAMPLSAAEQEAIDQANALAVARNLPGDPLDRGFGATTDSVQRRRAP